MTGEASRGATFQTLREDTFTQYRPVPSLITRVEFRYDKSDKQAGVPLWQ